MGWSVSCRQVLVFGNEKMRRRAAADTGFIAIMRGSHHRQWQVMERVCGADSRIPADEMERSVGVNKVAPPKKEASSVLDVSDTMGEGVWKHPEDPPPHYYYHHHHHRTH